MCVRVGIGARIHTSHSHRTTRHGVWDAVAAHRRRLHLRLRIAQRARRRRLLYTSTVYYYNCIYAVRGCQM